MALHTQEGAGPSGSCTVGTISALVPSDPACSFWPYPFSSAVSDKAPAAERSGAWLLAVALPLHGSPKEGWFREVPLCAGLAGAGEQRVLLQPQHRAEVLPRAPPERDPVPPLHTYTLG